MTYGEIKTRAVEILSTLPRAHYLRFATISISLSDTAPTSYFSPYDFEIVISMSNIWDAVKTKASKLSDAELETAVRTFTYHEVSHAMLTPNDLFDRAKRYKISKEMANTIEDERIETLLAKYYYGVDFKATAKAVLGYHEPHSFEEWVFYGLRVRKAPFGLKEMLAAFNRFLEKARVFTSTKDAVLRKVPNGRAWFRLADDMAELVAELQKIYDKHVSKETSQPNNGNSSNGSEAKSDGKQSEQDGKAEGQADGSAEMKASGQEAEAEEKQGEKSGGKAEDGEDEESQNQGQGNESAEGEDEEQDGKAQDGKAEEETEEETSSMSLSEEEAKEVMADAAMQIARLSGESGGKRKMTLADCPTDTEAKCGMLKAIIRNVGVGVATAPTIGAYNGKFSVKRYIKDQHLTMKWFDKSLSGGDRDSRKSSKKILNIWLDQSGSFDYHDDSVSKILKALTEIEQSRDDFEWRLIRVDNHFVIERNKEKRFSVSGGGNYLPKEEIERCYAETNKQGNELNLVIFDGEVGSEITLAEAKARNCMAWYELVSYENLKPFDNKRTVFIVEKSNTKPIKKVCPHALEVIEENEDYEGRLRANIVRAFDLLF